MINNFTSLWLLFLFLVQSMSAHANEEIAAKLCIPKQYFALGGIDFNDSLEFVNKKYGAAESIGTYEGEDDGGPYTGKLLKFEKLEVNIDQLRGIERISTINKDIKLASGVHVGMSSSEVGNIMHFHPLFRPGLIKIEVCGFALSGTQEIRLYFSNGKKADSSDLFLTQIEIVHYGP